ncbi:MAG TPA: hypothetical protein VMR97_11270, partial [Acidimicrobiales bacterium]|nr:hypothetical protein [Acidimicrobiales bacterium]
MGEDGFTVFEMAIAMTVMVVVTVMSLVAVQVMSAVSQQTVDQGQANQTSSIALTQLREEVLSANVLFPPTSDFNPTAANGGLAYVDGQTTGTDCASATTEGAGDGVN